jgi:hypothetical protein
MSSSLTAVIGAPADGVLPPPPLRLIDLIAAPAGIVRLGIPALEKGKGTEAFAGARNGGRRPARYEAALGLVA